MCWRQPCLFCGPFAMTSVCIPTAVGHHCDSLGFSIAADAGRSSQPLQWSLLGSCDLLVSPVAMCSTWPHPSCVLLMVTLVARFPSNCAICVKEEISRFLGAFLWDGTPAPKYKHSLMSVPHKSHIHPHSSLNPGAHLRDTPPPLPRTPVC